MASTEWAGTRVGFAGVDTSHPTAYAELLREWGCDLVAVYDRGLIHGPEAGARFAARHGISVVASSLAQLGSTCDVVFVNSADWTTKAPAARTLAEAGAAVFVDKPFGGGDGDWRIYHELVDAGARVSGGSALQWVDRPAGDAGGGRFAVHGDVVDYGVHAAALALACLGAGVERVSAVSGDTDALVFDAFWAEGERARVEIQPGGPGGYGAWLETRSRPGEVGPVEIDLSTLTRRHLEQALPYLLAGGSPRWTIPDLVLPERMIAAAQRSAQRGGSVDLAEQAPVRFDTASFVQRYRKAVGRG